MTEAEEQEFQRQFELSTTLVEERILPMIDAFEEEFGIDRYSTDFDLFVALVHRLASMGWTVDQLVREVRDHAGAQIAYEETGAGVQ